MHFNATSGIFFHNICENINVQELFEELLYLLFKISSIFSPLSFFKLLCVETSGKKKKKRIENNDKRFVF